LPAFATENIRASTIITRADEVIEQAVKLLQRMSLLLAPFGHAEAVAKCPLFGAKQKWRFGAAKTVFDPLQTSDVPPNILLSTGPDVIQVLS
jgi:hypothetical protein